MPAETVFVKAGSRRAAYNLFALLGYKPKCHWHWIWPSKGGYYRIPADKLAGAREIAGITKSSIQDGLAECW